MEEKEDKALFSFADSVKNQQERVAKLQQDSDAKQARAVQYAQDGLNPFMAYVEQSKPKDTRDEEARKLRAAKITAWSDMIGALGSGITGVATQGWQPKLENDRPLKFLNQAEQLRTQRKEGEQAYQKLKLDALLREAQVKQGVAEGQAQRADKELSSELAYLRALEKEGRAKAAEDKNWERDNAAKEKAATRQYNRAVYLKGLSRPGGKSDKDDLIMVTYPSGRQSELSAADEAKLLLEGRKLGLIPKHGAIIGNEDESKLHFDYNELGIADRTALMNKVIAASQGGTLQQRRDYTSDLTSFKHSAPKATSVRPTKAETPIQKPLEDMSFEEVYGMLRAEEKEFIDEAIKSQKYSIDDLTFGAKRFISDRTVLEEATEEEIKFLNSEYAMPYIEQGMSLSEILNEYRN